MPNCSVHILNKPLGVISNERGYFELRSITSKDTLVISYIGYEPLKISIHYILSHKIDSFFLTHKNILLPELIVGHLSPKELLRMSLQKSSAALMKNVTLNTYYREYLKLNGTIKKFSDGMVDFYIGNNKNNISTHIKSSRMVDSTDYDSRKIIQKFYDAIPIDQVISSYFPETITLLDIKHFKYYRFEDGNNSELNDFFIINVRPKKIRRSTLFYAKVFIDKADTLISKVQLILLPKKRNKVFRKSLIDVAVIEKAIIQYRFRKLNNRLYLSHFKSDIIGRHNTRLPKIDWEEECVTEMMVNNIMFSQTNSIKKSEEYNEEYLYQNGNHYKTEFWKTENIITATPEEQEFMSRIKENDYSSDQ